MERGPKAWVMTERNTSALTETVAEPITVTASARPDASREAISIRRTRLPTRVRASAFNARSTPFSSAANVQFDAGRRLQNQSSTDAR